MRTGHFIPSPAVLDHCRQSKKFAEQAAKAFWRYLLHDWGDITEVEKTANEWALRHGIPIVARYKTCDETIVITTDERRLTTEIALESEQ